MNVFQSNHATIAYVKLLKAIINDGELEAKTRDLTNINITLNNPAASLVFYKKNWKWAFTELFDRMSPLYTDERKIWNPGEAYHHRPAWKKKLEKEGGVFDYSYGDRFKDQVQAVIKLLGSKKTDREGIITVWDSRYLLQRGDYQRRPCTLSLHFFRRADRLNLNVSMRSNDVINLLPYDFLHHTFLQRYIAAALSIELGYYSHTVSHAYYPKRRESKGRQYFDKLFPRLENNWEKFNGNYAPMGTWDQLNHDFEIYYDGARDHTDFHSPFIINMIAYLAGKKINEFIFL